MKTIFSLRFLWFVLLNGILSCLALAQNYSYDGVYYKPPPLQINAGEKLYYDLFDNVYTAQELRATNFNSSKSAQLSFDIIWEGGFTNAERDEITEAFNTIESIINMSNPITVKVSKSLFYKDPPFNTTVDDERLAIGSPLFSGEQGCGFKNTKIWEEINLGTDSEIDIVGQVVINAYMSNTDRWFFGATPDPNAGCSGKFSLYSVALHEILHVLGFASQISGQAGESRRGYYSRWDRNLFDPNINESLLVDDALNFDCCDASKINDNIDFQSLFSGCPPKLVFGNTASIPPINSEQTNSIQNDLSHLSGCGNQQHLMNPFPYECERVEIGTAEIEILCALGYDVAGSSGTCQTKNICEFVANDDQIILKENTTLTPNGLYFSLDDIISNDDFVLQPGVVLTRADVEFYDCGTLDPARIRQRNGLWYIEGGLDFGIHTVCYSLNICRTLDLPGFPDVCDQALITFIVDEYDEIVDGCDFLEPCTSVSCGENLFCYGDLEDFCPLNGRSFIDQGFGYVFAWHAPLKLPFGNLFSNSSTIASNSPDFFASENGNVLRLFGSIQNKENIYFPLTHSIQPGCSGEISFLASSPDTRGDALVSIYSTNGEPLTSLRTPIEEHYQIPRTGSSSPNNDATIITCTTPNPPIPYPFCPLGCGNCASDPTILYKPYADFQLQPFTISFDNLTGEPINYIIIGLNHDDSGNLFIDDISVTADCENKLTVTPQTPPLSICLGDNINIDYEVCLTGSGNNTSIELEVNVSPDLVNNIWGDFAGGTANLNLTPGGACETVVLEMDFISDPNYMGDNILISILSSAENTCISGESNPVIELEVIGGPEAQADFTYTNDGCAYSFVSLNSIGIHSWEFWDITDPDNHQLIDVSDETNPLQVFSPGIYSVIHTSVTDCGEDVQEEEIIIDGNCSPTCCPDDSYVLTNATYSQSGFDPGIHKNVCVYGTFNIDGGNGFGADFQDIHFTMLEYTDPVTGDVTPAEIIVEEGIQVTMAGCTLEGGCEIMWKGISLEEHAGLALLGNTIKDAQCAVKTAGLSIAYDVNYEPEDPCSPLQGSNVVSSFGDVFMNNFIGIYLCKGRLSAINSRFDFEEFKSPFEGMSHPLGDVPRAGIYTRQSSFNSVVGCEFNNLLHGIIGTDANLTVKGTEFTNILTQNSTFFVPTGVGIRAGSRFGHLLSVGASEGTGSVFNNCTVGVFGSGMAIQEVSHNVMTDVELGIQAIRSNLAASSKFNNNNISSLNGGILLHGNSQTKMEVKDNILNVDDIGSDLTSPFSTGVFVSQYLPFFFGSGATITNINSNKINVNSAKYGVRVVEGNGVTIKDHYHPQSPGDEAGIVLNEPQNNIAGISLERLIGTGFFQKYVNQVEGNMILGRSDEDGVGIQSNMSSGLLMKCNSVNMTGVGIEYLGRHNSVDHTVNVTHEHTSGLHLDPFAEIGIQKHRGNNFQSLCAPYPAACPVFEAINDNQLLVELSEFRVSEHFNIMGNNGGELWPNPIDPASTVIDPNNNILEGWFTNNEHFEFTPSCPFTSVPPPGNPDEDPDGDPPPPDDEECEWTEEDYWVANNSMNYQPYSASREHTAKQQLYEKIKFVEASDTIECPPEICCPEIEGFYEIQSTGTIGKLYQIKEAISNLWSEENASSEIIEAYNDDLRAKTDEVIQIDLQLMTENPIDEADLRAQKEVLLDEIAQITENKTILLSSFEENRTTALIGIITQNELISTEGFVPVENEKAVNGVLLNYLLNKTLSNEEISDMESIALQCPVEGGLSVFTARSLLSSFKGDIYTNNNCSPGSNGRIQLSSGYNQAVKKLEKYFSIVPNPVTNEAIIQLNNTEYERGYIEIYNNLGQQVFKSTLFEQVYEIKVNTSTYTSGLYFAKVYLDNKILNTQKFIIQK